MNAPSHEKKPPFYDLVANHYDELCYAITFAAQESAKRMGGEAKKLFRKSSSVTGKANS